MVSREFLRQIEGYGLTTARILYRIPDHRSVLQSYLWQDYDLAPRFPVLHEFLAFWERELDGPLHSVRVAHCSLIKPAEFHTVNGVLTLH
ncbi:MAG: usg protein [Methylobacterium frigidaeris]